MSACAINEPQIAARESTLHARTHYEAAPGDLGRRPWPDWLRRALRFVWWIAPGALLALVPKCPACLAAYIALATGVALSLPATRSLQVAALVLSGALLGALVIRVAVRAHTACTRPH